MAEEEDKKEGLENEAVKDPNAHEFLGREIDKEVNDGANIKSQLKEAVEEALFIKLDDDDDKGLTLGEITYRENIKASLSQAAEAIGALNNAGAGETLKLSLDESGMLVSAADTPPVHVAEPQEPPVEEPVEKTPDPVSNPEDPSGEPATPDPDPLVDGTVIKATCWTTLDAASDTVETFATKLKESIENGDFNTDDVPYVPNFNGGDFVAGYDTNDKLVVFYLVTVADDWQTDLSDLRDAIGAFTIDATYMGLAASSDLEILIVPIYNAAAASGGCEDSCTDDEVDPYDLYAASPTAASYSTEADTWSITDGARDVFGSPVDPASYCGIKIRICEHVVLEYDDVAEATSGEWWHRVLTFDKCGVLTDVSASTKTEFEIET